jgi:ABC-type xylose transport system permease subunit
MTTSAPVPPPRGAVGRVLLAGAFVLAVVAAGFWFRWLPVDEEMRPIVAGIVLLAAIADAVVALRFLGERD